MHPKTVLREALILVPLLLILAAYTSSRDVSLGRSCTVSPPPSYPLTALPSEVSVLTDGKHTQGPFWSSRSTVGWLEPGKVEILVDLAEAHDIRSVSFSTARSESAEVRYPDHVFVFIGPDRQHLSYAGDIMQSNPPRGEYESRVFTLEEIDLKGRYVLLIAFPDGSYLFCDEITVQSGSAGRLPKATTTAAGASALANEMREVALEESILRRMAGKLRRPSPPARVSGDLQDVDRIISSAAKTPATLRSLEDTILARHAMTIRMAPEAKFVAATVSPWDDITPISSPDFAPDTAVLATVGAHDFAALMVTNLKERPEVFSVNVSNAKTPLATVKLFSVPFVRSGVSREYVADPLVPWPGSARLRTGESMLVLARVSGRSVGDGSITFRVAMSDSSCDVPVPYQVFPALKGNPGLNSVNWAYLTFKPVRNARREAVRDLLDHHMNVVVVPPGFNPAPRGTRLSSFSALRGYLRLHKGMRKVLFYLDVVGSPWRTMTERCSYLDERWKEGFTRWYTSMLKVAAGEGFAPKQIYLYPYDEVQPERFDEFVRFSGFLRTAFPGAQLYATINNMGALQKIAPLVDIAQVLDSLPWERLSPKTEYWRYFIVTKSTPSYKTMRLQAWQAFVHGYEGIGFWNYSDTGWGNDPGSGWDDFDGTRMDYAVVYEGPRNGILSSRRWEAWKLGMEDHQLLTSYSARRGQQDALTLARDVIAHQDNPARADSARRVMLKALTR